MTTNAPQIANPETQTKTVAVPFWQSRRVMLGLVGLLVVLGAWLRVSGLDGTLPRSPDERYYTWQANTLLEEGTVAGYGTLFKAFDRDLPPPTRIGYHWLLTTAMRLTGDRTVAVGAELACGASVLALALAALLGWRVFSPGAAAVATALYAVSPASLMFARRCWQESVVELLGAVCLVVAAGAAAGQGGRRRVAGWSVGWCAVGFACLTVKETAALEYLVVTGMLAVGRRWKEGAAYAAGPVLGAGLAAGLAAWWWAVRMGGFGTLARLKLLAGNAGMDSEYSRMYESGPWSSMAVGLWVISAGTLVLALAGVAVGVWRLTRGERALGWSTAALVGLVGGFLGLAVALPDKMNFRHVGVIFVPLALLAGVGVAGVMEAACRRWVWARGGTAVYAVGVAVALVAASDLSRFKTQFGPGMLDMSIRMVLAAGGEAAPVTAASTAAASAAPAVDVAGLKALAERAPSAEHWLNLSAAYAQAKQPQASLEAAQKCLRLDPQNALAWNNMAADYEDLEQWDLAIAAATRALQIQPEFQLAKNNLAWSVEQKRLAGAK